MNDGNLLESTMTGNILGVKHLPKMPNPGGFDYYPTPVKVGVCGNYEIRELEAKSKWVAVNGRNMYLTEVPCTKVDFGFPLAFFGLFHEGGMITSNTPNEIYTQRSAFQNVNGDVLVGGLGLGMCVHYMLRCRDVRSVTVVEISEEVIKLASPTLQGSRVEIVHGDISQYLDSLSRKPKRFDHAYLDTWSGTGEGTWMHDVVPLFRRARRAGIPSLSA